MSMFSPWSPPLAAAAGLGWLSVSGAVCLSVCLSAGSGDSDLSWLPALTCLGRARKGNGWELPSNHELVLPPPPFLSLPIPFPPSQPEGGSCCTAQNCSGTLGLGFFFAPFSSLSDEFLPFPCAPSQRGLLLQQRVSVVRCEFSSPRVSGGVVRGALRSEQPGIARLLEIFLHFVSRS